MNIPRRKFMKAGIVVAACASLPFKSLTTIGQQQEGGGRSPGTYFPIPAEVQNDPTNYYTMATFAPYVNSGFYILVGRAWKFMKLVEVKNLNPAPGGGAVKNYGECFSLTFLAPRGQKIQQQIYSLRHAALGKFSLFLVPIGRRTRTTPEYYEAVINRRSF
jgi:hypothetical protein